MALSLNRIAPQLPVGAVKTYQAVALSDETVVAACRSVGCQAYLHGWDTLVDESTDLGRRQATYIRDESGRSFKELRSEADLTVFRFDAYQRCFADHHTRPVRYLVRGGDWRADTGLIQEHDRPEDWVEDFADHQDRLAERISRG